MAEKTARGYNCTVSELAEYTGLARKTIHDTIKNGCPVVETGTGGSGHATIINVYEFMMFREGRGRGQRSNDGDAKSQLDAIRIERAQLDLSERRGDLFNLSDWTPLVESAIVVARNRFNEISREIIDEFSDVARIGQIGRAVQNKISAAINRMLSDLNEVPKRAADDGSS